jgi:hypothetical protein
MSFAIWPQQPPFTFDKSDKEQIYQVGGMFVVTDQGQPTQQQIDAVLNSPPAPKQADVTAIVAAINTVNGPLKAALDAAVAAQPIQATAEEV